MHRKATSSRHRGSCHFRAVRHAKRYFLARAEGCGNIVIVTNWRAIGCDNSLSNPFACEGGDEHRIYRTLFARYFGDLHAMQLSMNQLIGKRGTLRGKRTPPRQATRPAITTPVEQATDSANRQTGGGNDRDGRFTGAEPSRRFGDWPNRLLAQRVLLSRAV